MWDDRSGRKALRLALCLVLALFAAGATFGLAGAAAGPRDPQLVEQVSLEEILGALERGEKVVFVDVREPQEYREAHIPGALNYPTRHLRPDKLEAFREASYVIPYCLKDFRGFEGAKKLHRMGVSGVCLIQGFGISAWRKAGLPVAGSDNGLSDEVAMAQLRAGLR